jgi:hypothetical protein
MVFPKEFTTLQYNFAKRANEITSTPIYDCLFNYTSLPIRFGIQFSELNTNNPIWQEFLKKAENNNVENIIYEYHIQQQKDAPPMRTQFGCFSYDVLVEERGVKIHFANNDSPEPGVLSTERIPARKEELKEMFSEIKSKYPDFTFVISSSWLYNIPAFNRLFPSEFTRNLTPKKNDYRSLGIWGQFIDKYGNIKEDLKNQFNQNIQKAQTMEELDNAFPLKDMKAQSDISVFYEFLGVL